METETTEVHRKREELKKIEIIDRPEKLPQSLPLGRKPLGETLSPRYIATESFIEKVEKEENGKKKIEFVRRVRIYWRDFMQEYEKKKLFQNVLQDGDLDELWEKKQRFLEWLKAEEKAYKDLEEISKNYWEKLRYLNRKYEFLLKPGFGQARVAENFKNEKNYLEEELKEKKNKLNLEIRKYVSEEFLKWFLEHFETVMLPGITVGRSYGCDIQLSAEDKSVSRVHFMLKKEKGRIIYEHLGWYPSRIMRLRGEGERVEYIPDELDRDVVINLNDPDLMHQITYILPGRIAYKFQDESVVEMIKKIRDHKEFRFDHEKKRSGFFSYLALELYPIDKEPIRAERFGEENGRKNTG